MLIPVTLASPSSRNPKLPSGLARISHEEVVLIELQGSLEVESNHPSERNSKFVGKLSIDEAMKKPTLLIGHHLLEGKIQTLPKPLGVLVRSSKPPSTAISVSNTRERQRLSQDGHRDQDDLDSEGEEVDHDAAMVVDDQGPAETGARGRAGQSMGGDELEESGTGWTITAIVKKKIIFSKRPMPVMNKK